MIGFPKPQSRAAQKKRQHRETERHYLNVRRQVLERDRFRCRYCGSPESVEAHHLKPRSLGREDSLENLVTLCKIHHRERHAYRLFIHGNDANGRLRFEAMK